MHKPIMFSGTGFVPKAILSALAALALVFSVSSVTFAQEYNYSWDTGSDPYNYSWDTGSDPYNYSWDTGYTPKYTDVYYDEYDVKYSYTDSYTDVYDSYSSPSCFSCSTPQSFASAPPVQVRNPGFPSFPSYPSYPSFPSYPPSYPPQPPRPQPQSPIVTAPSSNTNVNTITNTNVNNIDNSNNSINGSFNTSVTKLTPVAQAPVQYPVQYVFPPTYQQPTYQNTYCTLTASPAYIQNGQAAYLSWTSYGATSAWLSDGIGMVAPNGSLAVRPNVSTTYTLTVSGYGGTRTCQAYVNVSGAAPYVALSQIPYTGLDLGTFGNALYWAGLLSFALASAYLVLYYRGGASILFPSILGGGVRMVKAERASGKVAAPAMFTNHAPARAFSPAVSRRALETLPVSSVNALKDSMAVVRSEGGEAPRIVVTRG